MAGSVIEYCEAFRAASVLWLFGDGGYLVFSLYIASCWSCIYLECEGRGEINLDCEQRPWRARAARQSPTCMESSTVAPFARQFLLFNFYFLVHVSFVYIQRSEVHTIYPGRVVVKFYLSTVKFLLVGFVWCGGPRDVTLVPRAD